MQKDFEDILIELKGIQAQLATLEVLYAEASDNKSEVYMSSSDMCDLFRGFENHLARVNNDFEQLIEESTQKEKPQTTTD